MPEYDDNIEESLNQNFDDLVDKIKQQELENSSTDNSEDELKTLIKCAKLIKKIGTDAQGKDRKRVVRALYALFDCNCE